jgi:hypothetical protein
VTILLTLSNVQSRHLQEIGTIVGALGGIALVVAAVLGLRSASREVERGVVVAAGVLLAAGFLLELYGLHRGF